MQSFDFLEPATNALDRESWMLVGGAMTLVHCLIAEVEYERPTRDVDIVVDPVGGSSLETVGRALERNSFVPVLGLQRNSPLHRFEDAAGYKIDVMGKDSDLTPDRWRGHRVVKCPGSKSALGKLPNGSDKEVLEVQLGNGRAVRVPNVWSALSIKGHALELADGYKQRHVQDAIALFACASGYQQKRALTKSERKGVNNILSHEWLADLNNWTPLEKDYWPAALSEMRRLRPQGELGVHALLTPFM